ncbi:MAG: S8 family peptidase [Candidatus Azobacteroides sp.]|nr:S8 family peptidase [Candidatus Azobacteroides sp.]
MKLISFFLPFVLLFFADSLQSQETKMYRLYLKDKGNPSFSPAKPDDFLSLKSIERRKRQNLSVDDFDLPLDIAYLEAITETGATIRTFSKWVETVVVQLTDSETLSRVENLPFIDSLCCVWEGTLPERTDIRPDIRFDSDVRQNTINSYGVGFTQVALNNGHLLHDAGFRGKGMTIAVLDGGFLHADEIEYFNREQIKEVKTFSHEVNDALRDGSDHGTRVLSCMLSDKSGELIGTAPEADYYLFRTEVVNGEYPVEEDYWIAALEYADSIGVDVVTSSLGYFEFDDSEMNHNQGQLDGRTASISRAADRAASRGLLLFNSAGNEGANSWKKINFPADAEHIITVGSVDGDSVRSSFSSLGLTADNRIKPDLMAMGSQACVVDGSGQIIQSNGTSYSTPILAGLAACLWEASSDLNSYAMLDLLRETGNHFQNPDSLTGYGIADVYKAYLQQRTGIQPIAGLTDPIYISINPFDNRLYVNLADSEQYNRCVLNIYTTLGNRILTVSNLSGSIDISSLPKGVYIVCLRIGDKQWVRKFVKN